MIRASNRVLDSSSKYSRVRKDTFIFGALVWSGRRFFGLAGVGSGGSVHAFSRRWLVAFEVHAGSFPCGFRQLLRSGSLVVFGRAAQISQNARPVLSLVRAALWSVASRGRAACVASDAALSCGFKLRLRAAASSDCAIVWQFRPTCVSTKKRPQKSSSADAFSLT